ncbi:cell division protein FtsX [Methylocystis parvus]|uniref:FtsX-like permease family protein n=1 Tax=Methylocystis parvus TaxID=134 RepID=A0A6B8ME06_9HYPH|nr:FtsX-like permease family protein [Methylocystis parvus]QGM98860.1 FtsX-like permease family protein [Methylocystis parvus]WBK00787.1 FtsX-like permease family protein [Methylocystis parvus OBBP]
MSQASFIDEIAARFRGLRQPNPAGEEDTPAAPSALVPTDSVAGRSLVIVIAIMTFLAALAAAAALLVAEASVEWRSEASSEASVQVRPLQGRDMEADLKKVAEILQKTTGVREAQIYTKAESEGLLAPWLGQGLDLSELPTPRMIVVKLDPKRRPDLAALREELASATPNAVIDDHHIFLERLGDMSRAVVAVSAMIFILIVGAMGIAVASATRAAVATNREIVEVLHIVGAADTFIAREFQRRFLALGLRGAFIGGGAAIAFLFLARMLNRNWRTTAGGEQMEAMFGDFSIGPEGFAIILTLAGGIALLTGFLSQAIVFHHLRRLG